MSKGRSQSGGEAHYDLVVVGSGAGAFVAALRAREAGRSVLIVEKLPVVGGTTSWSGGVAWIPNNPLMKRAGVADSARRALEYITATKKYSQFAGVETVPHEDARLAAFLEQGGEMVTWLKSRGMRFSRPEDYPDYHSDLPGAEQSSRSITAALFDLNQLGEWKPLFSASERQPLRFHVAEAVKLAVVKRSWAARWFALGFVARLAYHRILGRDVWGCGAALQGRLLQLALQCGVDIWCDTPVKKLVVDGERVTGVEVVRKGKAFTVKAELGVLLNAGGFSHNAEMYRRSGRQPAYPEFSGASPGDTGEMLDAAVDLGAATAFMNESLWTFASVTASGHFPGGSEPITKDVAPGHHFDISLPHCILVDQEGKRFANEAASYMETGQRLYQRHQQSGGRDIPAWAIIESRHRRRYPWGVSMAKTPQQWLDKGYMKTAASLEALALQCGIDPQGLATTVARFNRYCEAGVDEDFQRGGKAFDRCHGDPSVKPNPNLGAISKPPFYAVALYPGNVSTWGGLISDEYGRVCRADGRVIPGLYACGTTAASVFGRCYPGAGASIGPGMVFGYIAAGHACQVL